MKRLSVFINLKKLKLKVQICTTQNQLFSSTYFSWLSIFLVIEALSKHSLRIVSQASKHTNPETSLRIGAIGANILAPP
jgi:hypothetical protein